jgi:hypothetical protein
VGGAATDAVASVAAITGEKIQRKSKINPPYSVEFLLCHLRKAESTAIYSAL